MKRAHARLDGVDRYTTEIVAGEMQMLDSRGSGGGDFSQRQAPQQQPESQTSGSAPGGSDGDFDDDIPF